ncbi:helix-turn-helix transcriptional regulator [Melaminivora sp.]
MPPLRRAQQQGIARLRHLACLDDTGPHLIEPMLRALQSVLAFDSGGYYYPGPEGALDAYLQSPALQAVMPDYFDPLLLKSESRVLCRSLLNFPDMVRHQRGPLALEPGQLLTVSRAALHSSDYYQAIMRPADLSTWVALVLCTPQGCGLGVLTLYRHADGPSFTARELATLAPLEPWLARILQPGEQDADHSQVQARGLLIVSPQGRLLWASSQAQRLLPLAFGWRWRAVGATRQVVTDALPHPLQLLLQRLNWARQADADAALPQLPWRNAAGDFSLRATGLHATCGQGAAIALHITQRVTRGMRLLQALQSLALPPRQHALAYWIAQGCTQAQLSARLGISLPTVIHHRRALYERLGIHDRQGLLTQMSAAMPDPHLE